MFTGIIEEMGKVRSVAFSGNSGTLEISASKVLENTKVGDSIAVNGICLTATRLGDGFFCADFMAETFRKTNLSSLSKGSSVNLERAMAAGGRFGGHIVSGHIDGTGRIKKFRKEENAVWICIETDPEILSLIVQKGSVAIDGVSLTVAELEDDCFSVSVIPHTQKETTLLSKGAGDPVNLENDIVGKYVQRLMGLGTKKDQSETDRKIMDWLSE